MIDGFFCIYSDVMWLDLRPLSYYNYVISQSCSTHIRDAINLNSIS